jgi:hypothetical protein
MSGVCRSTTARKGNDFGAKVELEKQVRLKTHLEVDQSNNTAIVLHAKHQALQHGISVTVNPNGTARLTRCHS